MVDRSRKGHPWQTKNHEWGPAKVEPTMSSCMVECSRQWRVRYSEQGQAHLALLPARFSLLFEVHALALRTKSNELKLIAEPSRLFGLARWRSIFNSRTPITMARLSSSFIVRC